RAAQPEGAVAVGDRGEERRRCMHVPGDGWRGAVEGEGGAREVGVDARSRHRVADAEAAGGGGREGAEVPGDGAAREGAAARRRDEGRAGGDGVGELEAGGGAGGAVGVRQVVRDGGARAGDGTVLGEDDVLGVVDGGAGAAGGDGGS